MTPLKKAVFVVVLVLVSPLLIVYGIVSFIAYLLDFVLEFFAEIYQESRPFFFGTLIIFGLLIIGLILFFRWINSPEVEQLVDNYAKNYRVTDKKNT